MGSIDNIVSHILDALSANKKRRIDHCEEPARKKEFPWWVWLLVVLFPIPFGVVHWWVTLTFIVIFAVLMRAINDYYSS